MTRKDQMLADFDALAAAELDDIADIESERLTPTVQTRLAVPVRVPKSNLSAWHWAFGICVLGLVVLAARK